LHTRIRSFVEIPPESATRDLAPIACARRLRRRARCESVPRAPSRILLSTRIHNGRPMERADEEVENHRRADQRRPPLGRCLPPAGRQRSDQSLPRSHASRRQSRRSDRRRRKERVSGIKPVPNRNSVPARARGSPRRPSRRFAHPRSSERYSDRSESRSPRTYGSHPQTRCPPFRDQSLASH
jgi:hypothetical protein